MDIPRFLAMQIHEMSGGLRAEADPSRADIKADHFIVKVENFWDEPSGTFQNPIEGNYTFEQDGIPVEGFKQSLTVRVIWRSNYSGEHWRADTIEQTRKNAILFSVPFFVPAFGGKITGAAAELCDDGRAADIPNFEATNKDGPGLGFQVFLERDPGNDVVFESATKGPRQKMNGYIAEQHFVGAVYFTGGAEVPNDARRHT